MYLYNENRHTLHIKDCCPHSKGNTGFIPFETRDEALAYGKSALGWCKICAKKNEKMLNSVLTNQQG